MISKLLLHIIFHKWTFIDLMSNLMVVGTMWRIKSWNLFTLWIPLPQSLITVTMLPFCWLNLGSLYFNFTTIGITFVIVVSILGKTIVSCLVTSTDLAPLDILITWIVASCSTTYESEVQNFELFVQTIYFLGPLDNKEVKQICTLAPLPPFLTYWVSVLCF